MQKPFMRPTRILQVGGSTLALAAFLLAGQAYDSHAASVPQRPVPQHPVSAPQHSAKKASHDKTTQACTTTPTMKGKAKAKAKPHAVFISERDVRAQFSQDFAYPEQINIPAGSVINFVNKTNVAQRLMAPAQAGLQSNVIDEQETQAVQFPNVGTFNIESVQAVHGMRQHVSQHHMSFRVTVSPAPVSKKDCAAKPTKPAKPAQPKQPAQPKEPKEPEQPTQPDQPEQANAILNWSNNELREMNNNSRQWRPQFTLSRKVVNVNVNQDVVLSNKSSDMDDAMVCSSTAGVLPNAVRIDANETQLLQPQRAGVITCVSSEHPNSITRIIVR